MKRQQKSPEPDRFLLALRQRGVIALPPQWRTAPLFEAIRREDGVIELRPQETVDADQSWFWSNSWQKREREVQADIEAGRTLSYDSMEEMFDDLEHARLAFNRTRKRG